MASPTQSPGVQPEQQVALTVQLDGEVARALGGLAGEAHQPAADIAAFVIRHGLRHELRRHGTTDHGREPLQLRELTP